MDFEKEKRIRECAGYLRRCRQAGEVAFRVAEQNPEFAALLREAIEHSSLSDKNKAFALEGLPPAGDGKLS